RHRRCSSIQRSSSPRVSNGRKRRIADTFAPGGQVSFAALHGCTQRRMIVSILDSPARRSPSTLTRRAMLKVGAFFAGASALTASSTRETVAAAAQSEQLTGTWIEDAALPTGQPTVTIVTFISDGTLLMTSDQHLVRTPAHGAWAQTGDGRYAWSWWRLAF